MVFPTADLVHLLEPHVPYIKYCVTHTWTESIRVLFLQNPEHVSKTSTVLRYIALNVAYHKKL